MSWTNWHRHFLASRRRPLPAVARGAGPGPVPEAWRPALARSLARFQLGESGEGRVAREMRGALLPGVDAEYCACLELFVREERRHAEILAHAVGALGGTLLRATWSEALFRAGRRLLGVRLELVVLLAAEIVGLSFYRTLAGRLPRGALRDALRELVADELVHLEFHAAFFRWQTYTPTRRWIFRGALRAVTAAACTVVRIDHGATLRCVGVPGRAFAAAVRDARRGLERAVAGAGTRRGRQAPRGSTVIATDL